MQPKYKIPTTIPVLSVEQRIKFNEYVLSNYSSGVISQEEIFNLFTGKGGNENLSVNDFDSFNQFLNEKRAFNNGQFFTSPKSVQKIYEIFNVEDDAALFDPTCGHGAFINCCHNEENFTGVEYDSDVCNITKYLFPKASIFNKSIVDFIPNQRFDYILSNPPFNQKWESGTSQFYIVKKLVDWLNPYGLACVFVPSSYLNDEMTYKKDIDFINRKLTHIGTIELPFSFKIYGLKYDVKVLFFQNTPPQNEQDLFTNEINDEALIIQRINAIKEDRKNHFYNAGSIKNVNDYAFSSGAINNPDALRFIMKKYLYEIKRTKPEKLAEAYTLMNRLNEERPYGMSDESWAAYKITPQRLFTRVKNILSGRKNKNKVEKLVKTYSINELPFDNISVPDNISQFFQDFQCVNTKGKHIKLYDHQINDGTKHICKNNSILAHEQGTGKTVTAYAMAKYRNKKTYILAPAKVIQDVWIPFLKANKENFIHIKNMSDLNKNNNFILISYSQMRKSNKYLFKKIKDSVIINNSYLIADECDYLNNEQSQAYKITHATFRKVKYKTFMSGTPIHNAIEEYYPLFSILYNDSLINKCEFTHRQHKDEWVEVKNELKDTPFKHKGKGLFRNCFCPEKITVFGNNKKTQDLFNSEEFIKILKATLTSVSFEDVAANRYKVHTHSIVSSFEEKSLYIKILEETQEMIRNYYDSTGNAKKDAGLKLIRMINLLIDSVNLPEHFSEYTGKNLNTKLSYLVNDIKLKDELIVIGVTRRNAAKHYYNKLSEIFIDRPTFYVTGEISIDRRREILKAHEMSGNGILVCTQKSLSEGLNIGYVNEAYVMGLQWNMANIAQWYFRFIRIDQPNFTNIHIVIYGDSIEANLISLLKAKDKIVNFHDDTHESQIDDSILDMIMYKDKDKDGKLQIKWGESKIK